MKEISIEEKARRYDEAIERAKAIYQGRYKPDTAAIIAETLQNIFPALKESEDERIRKEMIEFVKSRLAGFPQCNKYLTWLEKHKTSDEALQYLKENHSPSEMSDFQAAMNIAVIKAFDAGKKQGEQKLCMIQWKGDNLKEVINFTGKDKNFDKWFKSFEEYEKYVHEHNDIFKLFNEDGSHYEVPIGAWIVKTPDGRNVASKAVLKQKPADKVEPKFHKGEWITNGDYTWKIVEIKPLDYILQSQDGNVVDDTISHVDEHFHSFTPQKEWGEYDRIRIANCIQLIGKTGDGEVEWLKSLESRIPPQPKQGWNEDTLKPSDDEMEALANALSLAKSCGEESCYDLRTLYEKLKKLKEG